MNELKTEKIVTPKDCASAIGSGNVEVLSTPTVLAWMEETAAELSRQFLKENETTVGARVELDHLAPSFVGEKVTIEAEVAERNGKKIAFDIKAVSGEKLLAKARHVRVIADRRRFEK